mgnify:CR=1 FL=1
MMRRLFIILIMIMAHAGVMAHEPVIIPTPYNIAVTGGYFRVSPQSTVHTPHKELKPICDYIVAEVGLVNTANNGEIELIIDNTLA